jgi:hypothetical protein
MRPWSRLRGERREPNAGHDSDVLAGDRRTRTLGDVNATPLDEAERILRQHSPADFDTIDAASECIEAVRAVEDGEAWLAEYESLDAFYAAHEGRHADIRFYAQVRHEIETDDPLTSPGGTIAQQLARLRTQQGG